MRIETDRSTDKERKWPVWVGTLEDIHRLLAAVEEMAKIRRIALLASFDEETERQFGEKAGAIEPVQQTVEDAITQVFKNQRMTERGNLERRLTVTTTLIDGDDTTKGKGGGILRELDRRSVQSVAFDILDYDEQIVVTLDRKPSSFNACGAELKVRSADVGWARQAFAYLSDEISKGEPRYSWIRKSFGKVIAGTGLALAFTLTVVLLVTPSVPSKWQFVPWAAGGYVLFILAVVLSYSSPLLDWLAPRFEIVGDDGQSTGRRRIGAVMAPILAIILGIIVNRIYS